MLINVKMPTTVGILTFMSRIKIEARLPYFNCLLAVMWLFVFSLFLMVPWVGVQYVVIAFPGHTRLNFGTVKRYLEIVSF